MNSNAKLSYAIAAILSGSSAGFAYAAPATDTETSEDTIQEITVTAQRRSENMQDVPIQIQALTGATLTQLSVTTFDDFVKYLPNVTSASNGPGQGVIFMRGLATSTLATQGSSGIGSFPNVAVYLDDQSGQLPGRNLDVYAADIERIEVLEGPQGTLFGAGAQAGVLRYITNKPKLDVTEGNVNAGYAYTSGGDNSSNVDAMINLPLIPDTLAVRGVIYNETRGGYINNLPSTFSRLPTDIGIHYAGYATGCSAGTPVGGACPTGATPTTYGVPPGSPTVNNNALVGNAINPVTYQGIRVGALYKINSDWDVLLVQSYQEMDSQGVFYVTPKSSAGESLPDLGVNLWNPAYNNDKFENTALTVNGKIGDVKLVYAGSYMVRKVDQQGDYTNYARGVYADYYQCTNPGQAGAPKSQCYSPSAYWRETDTATHNSQELRASTPDEWRWRGIGGLFWEQYTIRENIDWYYKTLPPCTTAAQTGCLTNVGPAPGAYVRNPNVRPDNESFFDDVTRGYTQKALFGSTDFDIIPKKLTATFGTRYYKIDTTASGSSISSFGCYADGPPPCTGNAPYSNDLSAHNLNVTYTGFKSRANLSWRPMDDVLLYYTWSQGFRPGGFNRGAAFADHSVGSVAGPVNGFAYTFKANQAYAPDTLTNNEIGWKTQWFDRRLRVQRRRLSGGLERRSGADFRVLLLRQSELRGQWPQLSGARRRNRNGSAPAARSHGHGRGVLEQQQLDQRALPQTTERRAHHHSRLARSEQLWRQSVRDAEQPTGSIAALPGESARALRMGARRLQGVLASRRHSPGAFLFGHRQHPDLRPSGVHDLRRLVGRREGCLDGATVHAEPDRHARQFVRERQPIRHGGDHQSPAHGRGEI